VSPSSPAAAFPPSLCRFSITSASTSPRQLLQSEPLRQGIKSFSDWPTIPQLYVKGEFVGGCDIVREMFQSGELKTLLAEQKLLPG